MNACYDLNGMGLNYLLSACLMYVVAVQETCSYM